jgi:hypothetical protein
VAGGDEICARNQTTRPRKDAGLDGRNRRGEEEEEWINRAAADGGGHRKPRTEAGDCDGEVGDSVRPRGWRESEVEAEVRCEERDFRRGEKGPRRGGF